MLVADSPRYGGGEGVLRHMAEIGVAAGHDVVLVARPGWLAERLTDEVTGLRARVISTPDFREAARPAARVMRLNAQVRALGRAIRMERPDLVQSSNGGYPGSALCLLVLPLAHALGVSRRFLAVHAVPRPRPEVLAAAHAGLDALVWRSAQRVWGATDVVGSGLVRLRGMPPDRYLRIPYGVEATAGSSEAPSLRAQWSPGSDDLVVGMVAGTSDAQKGHAVLIEALARTPPTVRGVIVGSEPPPAAMARARALSLGERLVVCGRLPDLGAAYHAFDVLCVPSVADESLPLVVLEAFAAGVPVVASRLSGLPEAVVDGVNGRLFTPGDASELAAILTHAAADRNLVARWGQEAHAAWRARFSLSAMRAGVLALWEGR
jgi:glycosyltransferase involved in cell wall biosynthesis